MGFEPGDVVQLSPAGRLVGQNRGLLPKNTVGRVLSISDEGHPGGPWEAIYVVDFDGLGVFMTESLIERASLLDHLAAEGK